MKNRQWRCSRYVPQDAFPDQSHFELTEADMPQPADGEVLLKVLWLGTSPAQRMYVTRESEFHIKVSPGEVMSGRGVAEVIASRHPDHTVGEIVQGTLGWQEYVALSPDPKVVDGTHVTAVRPVAEPVRPLSTILGIFGQLAFSAYAGIIEVGQVRQGDTVLVASAAGGVGTMACQLARIQGADRVVGIAGGPAKCSWLVEQGLCDAAVDYRRGDLVEQIGQHCPDGINVFLDSVGGDTLDAALVHLAKNARVAICGHISTEYQRPRPPGPTHYYQLLYQRARMEGFFVFDYQSRWPEFEARLREWQASGQLRPLDHVLKGIERMPDALNSLFTGANSGGCVVQVADDPEHLPTIEVA